MTEENLMLPPPTSLLLLLPPLWADYRLQLQELMMVQEGLCVHVPCRVSYSKHGWNNTTPAFGYWYQSQDHYNKPYLVATNNPKQNVLKETQGRFFLVGNPENCDCSLDIRDAKREDTGTYYFRVERDHVKYSYMCYKLSVHVTALTHTPDIHIQGTLETDHRSTITCSVPWACKRGTPPTFSWIGDALTSLVSNNQLSSVLTVTPRPQDNGSNLTCQVTFTAGVTVERTVQLHVTCEC
ncbi:sialic acid-binding Ig-like lectin 8 [Erinaceus europaeus]|uniref:Sialic acid-binding Ig-like lectin 8 n=1 Tax=Erinaceus europaeus TaxID=9365 RepID=A0ABM3X113_ERIEU|nr:sialic acid-binding Ig-like lectin 8 [Erinaceus europaeus]